MTYEEKQKAIIRAKRWINDVIDYHQDVLNGEEPDDIEKSIFEECEVILDALEKQILKKPIGDLNSVPHYRCPNCNKAIVVYEEDYRFPNCRWCGQAIDWSDEE